MLSTLPSKPSIEDALQVSLQKIRPNPEFVQKLRDQLHHAKDVIVERKPVFVKTVCMLLAFAGSAAIVAALISKITGKNR